MADAEFDRSTLTAGDLIDFEEVAGCSLDDAITQVPQKDENGETVVDAKGNKVFDAKMSAKAMVALAWVVRRRADPAFTYEDARNLTVDDIANTFSAFGDGGDNADPTDAVA